MENINPLIIIWHNLGKVRTWHLYKILCVHYSQLLFRTIFIHIHLLCTFEILSKGLSECPWISRYKVHRLSPSTLPPLHQSISALYTGLWKNKSSCSSQTSMARTNKLSKIATTKTGPLTASTWTSPLASTTLSERDFLVLSVTYPAGWTISVRRMTTPTSPTATKAIWRTSPGGLWNLIINMDKRSRKKTWTNYSTVPVPSGLTDANFGHALDLNPSQDPFVQLECVSLRW